MNSQNKLCYVNNWLVDVQSGSIIHQQTGEQKRLGEYQLKLLEALALHAGDVLTREQLTNLVWEGRVIGNNSLPNAVHALRIALEDDGKNQRIIKTIPKRGYLLEKEYCTFVSEAASNLSQQSDQISLPAVDDTNAEPTNLLSNDNDATIIALQNADIVYSPHKSVWIKKSLIYSLFVLCLISMSLSAYLYLDDDNIDSRNFIVRDIDTKALKNIEMYQVLRQRPEGDNNRDPDKLSERLNSALTELDARLEQTHSKMHVYYRSADSILNYAFSIENPCGKKELSMNIYHWRINNERLNTLIKNETERKLDEAASCNS